MLCISHKISTVIDYKFTLFIVTYLAEIFVCVYKSDT